MSNSGSEEEQPKPFQLYKIVYHSVAEDHDVLSQLINEDYHIQTNPGETEA
jgi:hypothetical protein